MSNIITIPAGLTGVVDLKDRSCKLTFETRELDNAEFSTLRDIRGQVGWLAFAMNPISEDDIPTEFAETEQKSPGKRMRSVLYILWKQEESELDFEVWYRGKMESIIESIKKKIR